MNLDKIAKLIYNANKENRLLNNDEIYNIIDFYINSDSRFKNVEFDNNLNSKNSIAAFTVELDSIRINSSKIHSFVENIYSDVTKYGIENNTENNIKLKNYYLVFSIFHELNHFKQKYNIDIKELFKYSCNLIRYNKSLYRSNHDLFPLERNANNIAFSDINTIMKSLYNDSTLNYYNLVELFSLLQNYDFDDNNNIYPPVNKLIININNVTLFNNNLSLISNNLNNSINSDYLKMSYGLLITFDKYSIINYMYSLLLEHKLKKDIIIKNYI